MKKHLLAGGTAAALALTTIGAGLASAASQSLPSADGTEGCAVGLTAVSSTCSYTPTVPGGYVGSPNVQLTITYTVHNADGTTSTVQASFRPSFSQENCALWTPGSSGAAYTNVTSVSATAVDNTGAGAIGQPYPSQSPKQLASC